MKRLLCPLLLCLLAMVCRAADKPNVIYILVDDAGYGDLSCYGQKMFTTPNIDKLAAEGMRFTRHYAGCTVCAPSRCVLMTGLHTGHCRVRGNGPGTIPDTDFTTPKLFKNAGYTTACIGKYGLGLPLPADDPQKKGFDYFFGYVDTAHAHNCYTTFLIRNGQQVPLDNQLIPSTEKPGKPGMGVAKPDGRKQWVPQLLGEDVQRYLDERGKDQKPFFLYYALNLPHANNEAGKDSPLGHGLESPTYGEFAARDWPDVEKGFASVMRFIDDQVGAVVAKVKALGMDDNTIILFTSDNGPHQEGGHQVAFFQSNDGQTGMKRDLTEGGVREPFIVRWPGKVQPGSESDLIGGFQDFMPTAAEITGAAVQGECDGISFLPTLLGKNKEQKQHDYMFWNFMEQGGKQSVLQWPWKLIHLNTGITDAKPGAKAKAKPLEVHLFNLEKDPTEADNVADKNKATLEKLEKIMKEAYRAL
jgi:arylsulfatase A-like enzyme